MKNKLQLIFSNIIFFAFGIFLTVIIKKSTNFYISNELDIVSIISLVVTLVFGIYISIILTNKEKKKIAVSEQHVNIMTTYSGIIFKELDRILSNGEKSPAEVNSVFKFIRQNTHKVSKYFDAKNYGNDLTKKFENILNQTTKIWEMATDKYNYDTNLLNVLRLEIMSLHFEINEIIIYMKQVK
jgi:hypothetical protein